jgi:hypothetical protein
MTTAAKPELGDRVRDKVSGFTGIVMARYEYLTGCVQYGVAPEKLSKDNKPDEWQQFDEGRMHVVKRGVLKLPTKATSATASDGGPAPHAGSGPRRK